MMSIIVRNENNEIFLFSKGADSVILPLLIEEKKSSTKNLKEILSEYGNKGLRTLVLAGKQISESDYHEWKIDHDVNKLI
jgi:magnesium-transporting ATPase (P-type)